MSEDLIDHEFVDNWCAYYDELKEHCQQFTPEWAASITGVPAEDIVASARLYAQADCGAIQWGLVFDAGTSSPMHWTEAVCDLMAICGNIEKPGGNIVARDAYGMVLSYPYGYDQYVPAEMQAKRIGLDFSPLHRFAAGAATAHGDSLLQTIETGTVSYTHLDVYKRQGPRRAPSSPEGLLRQ